MSAAGAAGTWSVVRTPNPVSSQLHFGALAGVSCPTATQCIAVGSAIDRRANQVATSQTWNGTGWMIQATARIPGVIASSLDAVACTATTACTAVGFALANSGDGGPLVERWNGVSWTRQSAPSARGGALAGVSCASPTACMAVGATSDSAGLTVPLAERWDGTTWSVVPTPAIAGVAYAILSAVSCTAPSACTAVGSDSGSGFGTVAERWNGTSWSLESTPTRGAEGFLTGVSCTAPTACVAVGNAITTSFNDANLAERWDGSSWTLSPMPASPPGATLLDMTGVSCATTTTCTAVGWDDVGALVYRFDGSAWKRQPAPAPGGPQFVTPMLTAVACPTAAACTAVGNDAGTLVVRWNGARWALQPSPNTPGVLISDLTSVSCPSAAACTAVGFHDTVQGGAATLAERWDGSRWTIQSMPRLRGALTATLNGVSCATTDACIAVGSFYDAAGVLEALAERWNGSAWSAEHLPPVAGAQTSLASVSCSGPTTCLAAGSARASNGHQVSLVERWDGTTWTVEPTPQPADSLQSRLTGISCSSASWCVAVGDFIDGAVSTGNGHAHEPLAEQWNGSSWTVAAVGRPPGAPASLMTSVSCTASTACTAVGWIRVTATTRATLAERWDGTEWSVEDTPNLGSDALFGVSCAGPTACTAVGASAGLATSELAEGWNGTDWTIEHTPTNGIPTSRTLESVACPIAAVCMAVGSALGSAGYMVTLAERFSG